jgi:hypothetical protein
VAPLSLPRATVLVLTMSTPASLPPRRSTKQVKSYAEKQTHVINPQFLAYSQSKYFNARDHLATQVGA